MYILNITPQTSPRPRLSKFGIHMPAKYMKYKNDLMFLIKQCNVPKSDFYIGLEAHFYFPYPKSYPKKEKIQDRYHQVKPDADNIVKGLQDCLESVGLLKNDSQICNLHVKKYYTDREIGYIKFTLF